MKDPRTPRNRAPDPTSNHWRQAALNLHAARGTYMRSKLWLLIATSLTAMILTSSADATTTPARARPATWRSHDLIVDFHDLPKRYTCDDLWYKLRDVLLAAGARSDMSILVYRCERGLAEAAARSPRAHLQFSVPEVLPAGESRWADLDVTATTVRLSPGHPASLLDSDCELLRQMKDGLLASLSQQIVSFDLACAAPHSGRWAFNVTVQTLTPSTTSARVVARVGALPNHR